MLNVSEIIHTVKQLIEVRIKLVKDEINEQISNVLTRILLLVLMGAVSTLILIFASFALAFYLSSLVQSTSQGFLYVALIYLLVLVLLYFLKDSMTMGRGFQSIINAFFFRPKKKIDNE
ncbi:phage holin family protein [Aquiflexum sp. TKW24L]|uniref:phage holin family protein n=1 Tax=Aquiflexum sp. TKW24L TaxID=2942212 RepID=UPI0020BDB836|nr:phage holin family protein [Aquiflexum sp. TKW24L]MCL6258899.1 phage holin family protein [Aquiflexum sp. TKW24L]